MAICRKNDIFTTKNEKKIWNCLIFLAKSSEKQKKVIIFADVQFSTQNHVKSKKKKKLENENKVIISAEVQFSTQNKSRAKKGDFSTQKQVRSKRKGDHPAKK